MNILQEAMVAVLSGLVKCENNTIEWDRNGFHVQINIIDLEKQTYILRYDATVTEWYCNGILHREDGPAIEWAVGTKEWFLNGRLHREDGPAIEYYNGIKEWWVNGQRHRTDGPAIVRLNDNGEWWVNGKRHRIGGPAVITSGGRMKRWYINGLLHREDGPAVENNTGPIFDGNLVGPEYWLNGVRYSEEEWREKVIKLE